MFNNAKITLLLLFFAVSFTLFANFEQPFKWRADFREKSGVLTISVDIPAGHYLYAKQTSIKVDVGGKEVKPEKSPVAIPHSDEFGSNPIYPTGKETHWVYQLSPHSIYRAVVKFQGCRSGVPGQPAVCFMPASEVFESTKVNSESAPKSAEASDPSSNSITPLPLDEKLLDEFKVVKKGGGYLNSSEFLKFLDLSDSDNDENLLQSKGFLGVLFFVLIGGLLLNFTPCVLPMIPVNIAIIGAGSKAGSKMQGFIRGGIYGLAIALSYGGLGLFSVLTGAKFGSLNSSSSFNFVIAAIFVFLALAMFDIITIDFSRFSSKFNSSKESNRTTFIAIFSMGIVSALLAGACVAPVVIAVLLYSTATYADGQIYGLFLPFLLGVGMALPWPFAGAGIALLPKPGMWMQKIKYIFGVFITLFAIYYIYIGVTLSSGSEGKEAGSSFTVLSQALTDAKKQGKPIFIDFWATWCKNCSQMEHSTFKDPKVKQRLKDFIVVKFQAEDIQDPAIKAILDRFDIPGLPGFVILESEKRDALLPKGKSNSDG